MASADEWRTRVGEWRRSGLTSEAFCARRDFTAGGLRHWSYRLGKMELVPLAAKPLAASAPKTVRFARVVRGAATEEAPIVIEVGRARVSVRRGFDREALGAVLEVLGAGSRG